MADTAPTPSAEFVAALAELSEPGKSGKVNAGQRRYSYMMLPDLLAEVREVFGRHNLAITQPVSTNNDGVAIIETIARHASGSSWSSGPLMMHPGANPQAFGSELTYMRRYQLAAFVGLSGTDDDDGGQATHARQRADEYAQTRPVTRERPRADQPDPTYTAPPLASQPEPGSPSTRRAASEKQTKLMWVLLRKAYGEDLVTAKAFVHQVAPTDTPDWHTADLTAAQASAVIDALQRANDQP